MKIFVEYKIHHKYREEYLKFIHNIIINYPDLEVYEGTDQSNLFVEIWNNCDKFKYENMKKDRIVESNPTWLQLESFVEGGKKKIHMWHFIKINKTFP